MAFASTDGNMAPAGYRQLTDLDSAVGVPGIINARAALIQALNQDVRWRDDGTDPTTSVGMVLRTGFDMYYTGDLSTLKFIEATAGAEINISLYKTPERQR